MSAEVERPVSPEEITERVLARFESTPDPRLREIMRALVTHLHGFVTDTGLTEAEWAEAIAVLTATGDITDDKRQEFILWSDTLGVSMLVDALAHPAPNGATESTVLGPFYVPGSPLREHGADISEQEAGTPAWVHGRVLDLDGNPIAGAELDVWQNGDNQLYAVQDAEAPDDHLRGRFMTDAAGRFAFRAVRPVPYPIPDDGPVGRMLNATDRHPWRPAHIHVVVRAEGFASVTTHIFDATSTYLDDDTVFAVKPSLLREFVDRAADDPERPAGVEEPWVSLELDLVLAPGESEIPADLGRTH
ncbi:MAG TPA: dioxygenase [Solirubrobacterales bacterium]|nr:dioxygenase [Solirubrobacterales bacterium]